MERLTTIQFRSHHHIKVELFSGQAGTPALESVRKLPNKSRDALETLFKLKDELDTLEECIRGFQPLKIVSRPSWSGHFKIFCQKKNDLLRP